MTQDNNPAVTEEEESMKGIPPEYLEFWDVFSGVMADALLPHQTYNLKIKLQEGNEPYHGPVYSLSQPRLTALHKFLDENMKNGFI